LEEPRAKRIQSVLFVCAMNAVRSPMAEAIARHYFGKSIYVQSAGIRKGETNGFMAAALDEIGIDASRHRPRTLRELDEWEGLNFDLIISLSPEAHHAAIELTRTIAAEVEYWPTPDATLVQGSREQVLDAYRDVRDGLIYRIRLRLKRGSEAKGPEDGERPEAGR
jgi:protein-tyrosine-phosphatase